MLHCAAEHRWSKLLGTRFHGCWYCGRFEVQPFDCEHHGHSVPVRWCSHCGLYMFQPDPVYMPCDACEGFEAFTNCSKCDGTGRMLRPEIQA